MFPLFTIYTRMGIQGDVATPPPTPNGDVARPAPA